MPVATSAVDTLPRVALEREARRLVEIGRNLVPRDHGRHDGLAFLGYGGERIGRNLVTYEPRVRATVHNLSMRMSFTSLAGTHALDRHSRRRGVRLWAAAPEVLHRAYPLMALQDPGLVAAPVPVAVVVLDDALAVFPGQPHWSGEQSAWATTDREVVATARRLVAATRAVAQTPSPAPDPPGERQLAVARLVLTGAKNAAVARHLGISDRTVGSDIAALARYVGVQGRVELVHRLGGHLDPRTPLGELSS